MPIACLALVAKIFPFPPDPNHFYIPRRLTPHEGRIAIVTDAGRDAVDAGGAADESADFADGEVVWSRRLDAGVKSARRRADDGDKKARSPGSNCVDVDQ